nr:DUF4158 domain-containing protein [Streptomyces hirsutus]
MRRRGEGVTTTRWCPRSWTPQFAQLLPGDPLDVPWPVVEHLAEQLGIEDVSDVKRYTERPKTAYEHAWEIRDAYEHHEYDEVTPILAGSRMPS